MLAENIKAARRAKGLSQEELAARLRVVRQTVSKWENNLSVPDADLLVALSRELEVPVERLLGLEQKLPGAQDPQARADALARELAARNAELAAALEREQRAQRAGEVRGRILLLSFLATLAALAVGDGVVSLLLTAACLLAAVAVLYPNLELLAPQPLTGRQRRALRLTTGFDLVLIVGAAAVVLLLQTGVLQLSQRQQEMAAAALVCCVMLFAGVISPRLPFNRYTGLRLPWTIRDEATWTVAHQLLGAISLPVTLLYAVCAWTVPDFEAVTLCAILVWAGVPSALSAVFYWQRMTGRR